MGGDFLSPVVAFAAGLATFVSPCVLPLVPAYLGYVGGVAAKRSRVFLSTLGFILGFSLVFALLGATASGIGRLLLSYRELFYQIGGAIIILLGLNLAGVIRLLPLFRHYQLVDLSRVRGGLLSSVLIGTAFGVSWTPCVGLELGAIFILASQQATVVQGASLLFIFGLGLGLPFLAASLALERFRKLQTILNPHLGKIEKASGWVLIILGILVFTGNLTQISALI